MSAYLFMSDADIAVLLGTIRLAQTLHAKYPDEYAAHGVAHDPVLLDRLAERVEASLNNSPWCRHCTLARSRRSSGLCDPCHAYAHRFGRLPSQETLDKRVRRYRGENTPHKVVEIPVDPAALDAITRFL